ncbi:MAG TPA: flavodoxin family protein [Dongiaceae bacterium]|jgi:multimeric flavodoxin WrbA|nr:flavodoxin family protein [Dongiaceae bacterium]
MNFCVVVGSSREHGRSGEVCELIRKYLKNSAVCDFVYLRTHRINLCDADNRCMHSPCEIKDDVRAIMQRMLAADSIIYMPVIHAYGTNSRFQAFLERVGYGFLRPLGRPLKDKLAGIVVVGRRYAHTTVYSQVVLNILLNKMILVGAGFPATFFGTEDGRPDSEAVEALYEMLDRIIEIGGRLSTAAEVKEIEEWRRIS